MPSSRSLASGLSQNESLAQMDQASSSRSRRSAPSSDFPSHSTRPWRELKSIHAVHPSHCRRCQWRWRSHRCLCPRGKVHSITPVSCQAWMLIDDSMRFVSCSALEPCIPVGSERWKSRPAQPEDRRRAPAPRGDGFYPSSWGDKGVGMLLEKGLDINGAQLVRLWIRTGGVAALPSACSHSSLVSPLSAISTSVCASVEP